MIGFGNGISPRLDKDSIQDRRPLLIVGDLCRPGDQVHGLASLQMNREFRIRTHVRQPVTFATGLTGDVVAITENDEIDLDPP